MTIEDAAAEMQLRYLDCLDNNGSSEADYFWHRFEEARDTYRRIKEGKDNA